MLKILMKKKQFYHVSKREGKCFDEKKNNLFMSRKVSLSQNFYLFVFFFQLKLQLIVFVQSIYLVIDYMISKLWCGLINPQETAALCFDESKIESC